MTLTRNQVIGGIVSVVVLVLIGYGIWLATADARDPYAGLKTHRDVELSDANREYFASRLAMTEAAVAAAQAAGEEPLPDLYIGIASDALALGDLVKAREAFEKVLGANSLNYAMWNSYGSVLEEMGDYAGAETAYKKALELNGGLEEYYRDYAGLLLKHFPDRRDDAKAVLELSVQHLGQTTWNMVTLAEWYKEAGDCDRSIDHYEVAITLAPENQAIKDDLAAVRRECRN